MILLPYDPNEIDNTNSKFCQQCRKFKSIKQFISKNRMGICVLCNLCREKQKLRAKQKREARKRELQRIKESEMYNYSSDSSSQHASPVSSPTISGENEIPRIVEDTPLPIPCSKWIVVKDKNSYVSEQVFNAKLVYRRS